MCGRFQRVRTNNHLVATGLMVQRKEYEGDSQEEQEEREDDPRGGDVIHHFVHPGRKLLLHRVGDDVVRLGVAPAINNAKYLLWKCQDKFSRLRVWPCALLFHGPGIPGTSTGRSAQLFAFLSFSAQNCSIKVVETQDDVRHIDSSVFCVVCVVRSMDFPFSQYSHT